LVTLTVEELIEKLKKLDGKKLIYRCDSEYGHVPIRDILVDPFEDDDDETVDAYRIGVK
jgi:hypothetical protein